MVNDRLKKLCSANNLEEVKLTTYWARHTYASLLKESGESIELIRELLGHSDIKTTESYLKRFDLKKKKEANERLESLYKGRAEHTSCYNLCQPSQLCIIGKKPLASRYDFKNARACSYCDYGNLSGKVCG